MKYVKRVACLAILVLPFVAGCGGGGEGGTVADGDDIASYVAANPESDAGTETEGGDE